MYCGTTPKNSCLLRNERGGRYCPNADPPRQAPRGKFEHPDRPGSLCQLRGSGPAGGWWWCVLGCSGWGSRCRVVLGPATAAGRVFFGFFGCCGKLYLDAAEPENNYLSFLALILQNPCHNTPGQPHRKSGPPKSEAILGNPRNLHAAGTLGRCCKFREFLGIALDFGGPDFR